MMDVTHSAKAIVTLPSDEEILITREFDAPRHLVYRAWTTPELVKRWWTGRGDELTVCEIDLRVGGRWRYAMAGPGGSEIAFNGVFSELVPDERIVTTEAFEGMPDAEPALNIITFAESGGRTAMELLIVVKSREERDMILATGMTEGAQMQFDQLDELASSLA
jgi:uncharacterized protein YndB with AHSA1/START domain